MLGLLQIPSTDFVQKTSCKCRRKISRKGISMNATDRSRNGKVISSFVDPRQRAKAVNSRKRKRERMRSLNIGSPLKAIRHYCLDCTGGSTAAVKGSNLRIANVLKTLCNYRHFSSDLCWDYFRYLQLILCKKHPVNAGEKFQERAFL